MFGLSMDKVVFIAATIAMLIYLVYIVPVIGIGVLILLGGPLVYRVIKKKP
ncbi:MAG: hypothetical protein CSYNP_03152 [Syntrophus sp. SKADARSKE-3]|nr:hypothetical protein [Syntrophus sp. SKADARSKE-3]